MIAVTQPLRIGDWVEFEEHYGVVEDITLSFTILRTGAGQRFVIPNEKLAGGVLRNDSLVDGQVALEISLWLPPGADSARALEVLGREGSAAVAESAAEGFRITVSGEAVSPAERAGQEAQLRGRCLERLRTAGVLAD
jgi:small-conductance mechanosensitive channel